MSFGFTFRCCCRGWYDLYAALTDGWGEGRNQFSRMSGSDDVAYASNSRYNTEPVWSVPLTNPSADPSDVFWVRSCHDGVKEVVWVVYEVDGDWCLAMLDANEQKELGAWLASENTHPAFGDYISGSGGGVHTVSHSVPVNRGVDTTERVSLFNHLTARVQLAYSWTALQPSWKTAVSTARQVGVLHGFDFHEDLRSVEFSEAGVGVVDINSVFPGYSSGGHAWTDAPCPQSADPNNGERVAGVKVEWANLDYSYTGPHADEFGGFGTHYKVDGSADITISIVRGTLGGSAFEMEEDAADSVLESWSYSHAFENLRLRSISGIATAVKDAFFGDEYFHNGYPPNTPSTDTPPPGIRSPTVTGFAENAAGGYVLLYKPPSLGLATNTETNPAIRLSVNGTEHHADIDDCDVSHDGVDYEGMELTDFHAVYRTVSSFPDDTGDRIAYIANYYGPTPGASSGFVTRLLLMLDDDLSILRGYVTDTHSSLPRPLEMLYRPSDAYAYVRRPEGSSDSLYYRYRMLRLDNAFERHCADEPVDREPLDHNNQADIVKHTALDGLTPPLREGELV
ncbi:hypothetical protein KOR34_02020 [Posidoniimonas corsicana]|uniref:Uncharacterized protein n=1 Tax=Posidoniimonas corsicana TaxID=1938618 RepID=A0A5C5VC75_9BACT|nr:hypothetical protein [Posidoniimonas corsicana]TWT35312.1 hypothetical protein KOR34_02020 [Posidoniimonas corsicana]